MKKYNLLSLFLFALICCFACNDDEEEILYFDPPSSATESIGQDEIRLLIAPYLADDSVVFTVGFGDDNSKKLLVNWGDDNILHPYKEGDVKHKYSNRNREYIVTIKAPGIKSFEYRHQQTIGKTKSVAFGKCPSLESLRASMYNNIYENFDLSQCPQFNGDLEFHAYTGKFNFHGLRNFEDIFFYGHNFISAIEMRDMNFTDLRLIVETRNKGARVEKFYIENSRDDVESIQISFVNGRYPALIENSELNINNLKVLYLSYMIFNEDINLSKLNNLKWLQISDSDYPGIKIPQNLEEIRLDNQSLSDYCSNQKLVSLDFSECPEITRITLAGLSNLRSVNIKGLEKLNSFSIYDCPLVEVIGELPDPLSIKTKKLNLCENENRIENYMIDLKANK